MNALQPGVPAFTRAEYVYELRGNIARSQASVKRTACGVRPTGGQGVHPLLPRELAFNTGAPAQSLRQNELGLARGPDVLRATEGKAKAEAALGPTTQAQRDYYSVVGDVPQPEYVVEAGDYLTSLGDASKEAQQEYRCFATENQLFEAQRRHAGHRPDAVLRRPWRPELALNYAQIGIEIRPFIEMDDAYAWALHATTGTVRRSLVERRRWRSAPATRCSPSTPE